YLADLELWGYEDARLAPHGSMSEEDASIWTAAIDAQASRPLGERPREVGAPKDQPIEGVTHGSVAGGPGGRLGADGPRGTRPLPRGGLAHPGARLPPHA